MLRLPTKYNWLAMTSIISFANGIPATAQIKGYDKKYACVLIPEKMPELQTGGGMAAIARAIQQRTMYSSQALKKPLNGRVFIRFTVTANGIVDSIRVVKSLRPDYDAAAVRAVSKLPPFKPSSRNGKPAPVSIIMPISFRRGLY